MKAAHSSLSPSAAKRWINCAGSVALCETLPPEPPSSYAEEGTVAHKLAEELVTGKTDSLDLMDLIGTEVESNGLKVEITEEMVDGVIEYADVIKWDTEALRAINRPALIQSRAEFRICASSVDKELWGTSDYVLYRKGHKLLIYDFKYGKKVVEAKENEQMATYAVGVMDTEAGWAFDEVELVIVQPRAGHSEGRVRRWITSTAWLTEFKEKLKLAAAQAKTPNAELTPGDWCQSTWCPARSSCPALAKEIQKQAGVDFSASLPSQAPVVLPNVELMPVVLLAKALKWEDTINSWYEALKLRARGMLELGQEVPGFKLVDGKSNRKWISEDAVIRKYAPTLGEDRLFEKKLLSPAKLEKIVGKGKLEDEGLTFKPEAPKSIASVDDPRPEARSSAADDFRPAKDVVAELEKELLGTDKEDPFEPASVNGKDPLWPQ